MWFWRSFRNSCLSASLILCCIGVWQWLAVKQVLNHNQSVLSGISLQIWRCGSQDYLYSGNYRRKRDTYNPVLQSSFHTLLSWGTFGVWDPSHHCVCFFFFFFLNFLSLFSVPILLTSSPPTPLLCLLLFVITIYHKDLSPSFSPALCPPFPSMSWRFKRTSYCCCCSVSRECPTPCWGLGTACLRSRTGKWPRWPKWPPGRTRCGRQQRTLWAREIVIMRKKNKD